VWLLGKLIIARQKLAHLLSFDSFAHKGLSRKVLTTPQRVQELLLEAARCVAHQADTEADLLRSVKTSLHEAAASRSDSAKGFVKKQNNRIYSKNKGKKAQTDELENTSLSPWDESYLINSYKSITGTEKARAASGAEPTEQLGEFLSVASCMNGLRFVCAKVFGIEMQFEELTAAEVWTGQGQGQGGVLSQDLLKCSFTGPQGDALGYIYFDLYARPNKFTGAAHFTIRCGCSNLAPSASSSPPLPPTHSSSNSSSPWWLWCSTFPVRQTCPSRRWRLSTTRWDMPCTPCSAERSSSTSLEPGAALILWR
jgi:Zn-dependent oligopeptidase